MSSFNGTFCVNIHILSDCPLPLTSSPRYYLPIHIMLPVDDVPGFHTNCAVLRELFGLNSHHSLTHYINTHTFHSYCCQTYTSALTGFFFICSVHYGNHIIICQSNYLDVVIIINIANYYIIIILQIAITIYLAL